MSSRASLSVETLRSTNCSPVIGTRESSTVTSEQTSQSESHRMSHTSLCRVIVKPPVGHWRAWVDNKNTSFICGWLMIFSGTAPTSLIYPCREKFICQSLRTAPIKAKQAEMVTICSQVDEYEKNLGVHQADSWHFGLTWPTWFKRWLWLKLQSTMPVLKCSRSSTKPAWDHVCQLCTIWPAHSPSVHERGMYSTVIVTMCIVILAQEAKLGWGHEENGQCWKPNQFASNRGWLTSGRVCWTFPQRCPFAWMVQISFEFVHFQILYASTHNRGPQRAVSFSTIQTKNVISGRLSWPLRPRNGIPFVAGKPCIH